MRSVECISGPSAVRWRRAHGGITRLSVKRLLVWPSLLSVIAVVWVVLELRLQRARGKMAATAADECNSARSAQYNKMATRLADEGFNSQALETANENFVVGTQGELVPKHYDMAPWQLSYPAVRLHCLVFRDTSTDEGDTSRYTISVRDPNKIGQRATEFATRLKATLLEDSKVEKYPPKVYLQELANMHITLFHPSAPSQPNIFRDEEEAALEIALSRQLIAEFSSRLWQRQEESQPVIELVVDRVLMTPGGVLLILFQPKV